MALTSIAEQKQQSYLRGFLALSELLIHHVSSLFCLEMQKEILLFNRIIIHSTGMILAWIVSSEVMYLTSTSEMKCFFLI